MSATLQWTLVAVAVAIAAAYALKVLLPRPWRARLAGALRVRHATALAQWVDGGQGGCSACPAAGTTHGAGKRVPRH